MCMKKFMAEMIGTMTLVLFGCGAAVIAGPQVGQLGIAFAFGLALIAMAYGIGPISGCHINPAVTIAAYVSGRMEGKEVMNYILAQCVGAIVGAFILSLLAKGSLAGYDIHTAGLGQNGWGAGYLGAYDATAAFTFELVATFIFVTVILGATQVGAPPAMAGLAIGLTLVVIHIFGINITGVSVNPARSLGPALLVGGQAMQQLWLFIAAPIFGGIISGALFKNKVLEGTPNAA